MEIDVVNWLFFFNDTATTEIYTLSLPTLFRSPSTRPASTTLRACTRTPSSSKGELPLPPRMKGSSDRKSTRLNSSHGYISYAVFCLKKYTGRSHLPAKLLAGASHFAGTFHGGA